MIVLLSLAWTEMCSRRNALHHGLTCPDHKRSSLENSTLSTLTSSSTSS